GGFAKGAFVFILKLIRPSQEHLTAQQEVQELGEVQVLPNNGICFWYIDMLVFNKHESGCFR
ncbi:hypothetical protein VF13_38675, partial [Nostoc linckia z16]